MSLPKCFPNVLCRLVALFLSVGSVATSYAGDITTATQQIQVVIKNAPIPTPWEKVGWIVDGNDIYLIYSGKLRDPAGKATEFNLNLEFTALGGLKLVSPATQSLTVSADKKGLAAYELKKGSETKIIGNVHIVAVETKINNTLVQNDDLIAVSKGTDDDLATDFSVRTNDDGLTADLSVKPSDGDIKFKSNALNLVNGKDVTTKLWGIKPSSAEDKTIILVSIKRKGKVVVDLEEDCTVFKGAKLDFSGNYYINVDTRDWVRRPWDGRKDPKPNTKGDMSGVKVYMDYDIGATPTAAQIAAYKKAVDQDFSFGYESAISFNDGDNAAIKNYKPWKDKLQVKINKVMAIQPSFEIKNDKIIGALVNVKKGALDGLPDGSEQLINPEIEVADFLVFDKPSVVTRIAKKTDGAASVTEADVLNQIKAARSNNFDELLDYYMIQRGTPPAPTLPKEFAAFSHRRYEWKNDSFDVQKGSKITESVAAKAIRGEKENGNKVEIKWIFTGWNEFKFQGDLEDAIVETK